MLPQAHGQTPEPGAGRIIVLKGTQRCSEWSPPVSGPIPWIHSLRGRRAVRFLPGAGEEPARHGRTSEATNTSWSEASAVASAEDPGARGGAAAGPPLCGRRPDGRRVAVNRLFGHTLRRAGASADQHPERAAGDGENRAGHDRHGCPVPPGFASLPIPTAGAAGGAATLRLPAGAASDAAGACPGRRGARGPGHDTAPGGKGIFRLALIHFGQLPRRAPRRSGFVRGRPSGFPSPCRRGVYRVAPVGSGAVPRQRRRTAPAGSPGVLLSAERANGAAGSRTDLCRGPPAPAGDTPAGRGHAPTPLRAKPSPAQGNRRPANHRGRKRV